MPRGNGLVGASIDIRTFRFPCRIGIVARVTILEEIGCPKRTRLAEALSMHCTLRSFRWFRNVRLGWALAAWGAIFSQGICDSVGAATPEAEAAVKAVRSVQNEGKGHREAILAAKKLSSLPADQLTTVLAAMDGAGELPTNWLRTCVETISQNAQAKGQKLPVDALEKFLAEKSHSPRGRRLAYELIAAVDAEVAKRLVGEMLSDPSLELRRDAVAQFTAEGEKLLASEEEKGLAILKKAFQASRDLDQIKDLSAKLKDKKQEVDLATHMGYLMTWRIVGPFDNGGDKGWDVAYAPEQGVDVAATYEGQKGKVNWIEHTTKDDYGVVDLTQVLDKHKGAITYAYTEFVSPEEVTADLRLGSINATKLWLNGELLGANHVYHAGMEVDQYMMKGKLKKGKNQILIKVCQNEQTEPWAQRWQFQLRICDSIGTAILSSDRKLPQTAFLLKPLR